ncbi:MAG: hypothetical protein Q7R39_15070 [Dehalococcoidia bacterium]|nr:hypothetical protein [Dehalococcoidia bacterium]
MPGPGWVTVLAKYCPDCRQDYPRDKANCPRCGRILIEKMLRKPASES